MLLCTKFSLNVADPWLTNELAEAFSLKSHHVQVVLLDWSSHSSDVKSLTFSDSVKLLVIPPFVLKGSGQKIRNILKWCFSSNFAKKIISKNLKNETFDLIIGFSPAIVTDACMKYCMRRFNAKSYLVYWDFFPYHQMKMGLIKNKLISFVAKQMENRAISRYDKVGCMTEQCVNFMIENYQIRPQQRVEVLPVWGKIYQGAAISISDIRKKYNLPINEIIFVFGGQLTFGRGVEEILQVAEMVSNNNISACFLFVGHGPFEPDIIRATKKNPHVIFLPRMMRVKFLELLAACDVGIVSLIKEINIPSFPSKTIDYLRLGLPIIASIDDSTDYIDFLKNIGNGLISPAGDSISFYEKVVTMVTQRDELKTMGLKGKEYFYRYFDVNRVSEKILAS